MIGCSEVVIVAIAVGKCAREVGISLIFVATGSAHCCSHIISLTAGQNAIFHYLGSPCQGFLIACEFVQRKSAKRSDVVVEHQHVCIVAFCQVVLLQAIAIKPCTKYECLSQFAIIHYSHIECREGFFVLIFGYIVDSLLHNGISISGIECSSEAQGAIGVFVEGHSSLYLAAGNVVIGNAVVGSDSHPYGSESIVVATEGILRLCLVVIYAVILKESVGVDDIEIILSIGKVVVTHSYLRCKVIEHAITRSLADRIVESGYHGVVLHVAHSSESLDGILIVGAHAQCRNKVLCGGFVLLHHYQHLGAIDIDHRFGLIKLHGAVYIFGCLTEILPLHFYTAKSGECLIIVWLYAKYALVALLGIVVAKQSVIGFCQESEAIDARRVDAIGFIQVGYALLLVTACIINLGA